MRVDKKPEQKKPEKFVPAQPMGKIAILTILVIVSTALFWLAWHNALTTGLELNLGTQNIIVVVSTLLAFCLMFTLLAVTEVLVTKSYIEMIITVLAAATMFIFFKPTLWSFIAWLIVVLGFLYWRREVRLDEKTRTKFLPQKIISAGLKTAVTLVLLAACFNYYSYVVSDNGDSGIADKITDSGADVVQNVLGAYYKERYDPQMSLDEFLIGNNFSDTMDLNNIDTGMEELDKALNEGLSSVEGEIVDEARNDFLKTFDIEATGDEAMQAIVSKIIRKNINRYAADYLKFIPALMALGLFFIMNIFSFIYRELIKSFSYLLFHILVWLKFIKVEKIQVEAEKITL